MILGTKPCIVTSITTSVTKEHVHGLTTIKGTGIRDGKAAEKSFGTLFEPYGRQELVDLPIITNVDYDLLEIEDG